MPISEDFKTRLYQDYATDQTAPTSAPLADIPQGYRPYLLGFIQRWVPADRSLRIVDLGCGSGTLLQALRELGYENLFGVDVSPEQVALANRRGLQSVVQGELQETLQQIAPESVDVLFAFDILEHLTRAELLATGDLIHRVLKTGGRLVVHVPNAAALFSGSIRYSDLTHELAFTPRSLRQFGNACGLRLEAVAEDTPIPHGLVSACRWLLWKLGTLPLRLLFMAERPLPFSQVVLSQNIQAMLRKK